MKSYVKAKQKCREKRACTIVIDQNGLLIAYNLLIVLFFLLRNTNIYFTNVIYFINKMRKKLRLSMSTFFIYLI